MKAFASTLLALASMGCSRDKTADEAHKAATAQREAEARTAMQASQERKALNIYDADARASCAAEIKRRLDSPVTVVPEGAIVKWDPGYLAGERSRTKQQFPASESLIVTMAAETKTSQKSQTQFTCQVVCLNKGYCNTVSLKP